jgi:hypothetical protein
MCGRIGLVSGPSWIVSTAWVKREEEHVRLRRADEPRGRRFAHLGDTFL